MKEILLKQDGSINEIEIDRYIARHGVDALYDNPESIYNGKSLLYVAISSDEIPAKIKLELVSYLIKEKASIKEGLVLALYQNHLDLLNLLSRNNASITETHQGKTLIDVALDLKNEQMLLWVLKFAQPLFMTLTTQKIEKTLQDIQALFPENNQIQSLLEQIFTEYLQNLQDLKIEIGSKFSRFGLIDHNDVALILAAKMSKKPYPNSIFVITEKDGVELTESIKNLIEKTTNNNLIKFQIIHFTPSHTICGEFEIDKSVKPPIVRYLHCDPLPSRTDYSTIINEYFINVISPIANIEIYDSKVVMQKTKGSHIFQSIAP